MVFLFPWSLLIIVSFLTFTQAYKPRVFILTDIDNEPDDAQSLTRLLLYSNEVEIEGLVSVTSQWLRYETHPERIHSILSGYSTVHSNLLAHSPTYPLPQSLKEKVFSGLPDFGLAGVGEGKDSAGSEWLISVVDKEDKDSRPVFVQAWGGANCLAQALYKVNSTRSASDFEYFISKIRVYAISDQDNAGPWIRDNFPTISYIASVHAENQYSLAAWHGISGEAYTFTNTALPELISNAWIQKHIQLGPYGGLYPDIEFIMEGDTPAFLGTIPNGLNDPRQPTWGGWGGRYMPLVNSGTSGHLLDTTDSVRSPVDGLMKRTSQATIWRWREAVQWDFASRIQWTLTEDYSKAVHPPTIVVNGHDSTDAMVVQCLSGETIHLDASKSYSPDGLGLTFKWYQYKEVDAWVANANWEVPTLEHFDTNTTSVLTLQLPETIQFKRSEQLVLYKEERKMHVILEVTTVGEIPVTRYKRVILHVKQVHGENTGHDEL